MAKVLVVDDIAANRLLIVRVLGYQAHQVIEAADGAEALALVRAERPELVISDILMPTMDGYEFVRQLRADPELAATAVIFYTAHYHQREARKLAAACGVSRVLVKPCTPEEILRGVNEVLASKPDSSPPQVATEFEHQHLRLVTDKLARNTDELRSANSRLVALTELNVNLASERDPLALLTAVCRGARDLIGSRYAVLTAIEKTDSQARFFATSGIDAAEPITCPNIDDGPLRPVMAERKAVRLAGLGGDPRAAGLPAGFPPLSAALIAPLASSSRIYGWICLADKLGGAEFSDEDERVLTVLAAQAGRAYENGTLYVRMKRQAEQLLLEMAERERAVGELHESERRFRDVLGNVELLSVMLDRQARITYCNEHLLRVTGWQREEVLGRDWFELFVPAEVREARKSVFAALLDDSPDARHHESDMVMRSGDRRYVRWDSSVLRAASGEVIGTASIGEDTTERRRAVATLRESEERFRQLAENIDDVFYITAADSFEIVYVSPAYERIWARPLSAAYDNVAARLEIVHAEDRARVRGRLQANVGERTGWDTEYRIVRPDGSIRWILDRTFPIHDANGRLRRLVGVATDITERRQARAKIEHLNRVLAMRSGINALIVRERDRTELLREACRLAVDHGRFKIAWIGTLDAASGEVSTAAQAGDNVEFLRATRISLAAGVEQDTLASIAMSSQRAAVRNDLEADAGQVRYRDQLLALGCRAIAALPLVVDGKSVGCFVLATEERGLFDEAELRLLNELAGDVSFALDYIEKADRLSYLAYYDALTGLANRTFFGERLSQYVAAAGRAGTKLALVIVETTQFETINDLYGRHVGDVLLRQVAERFAACVGNPHEVGRVGPDYLAAVIPDVREDGDVARRVEEWWQHWLGEPFQVNGSDLQVSARSGIALFPSDGRDANSLLKNAEAALRKAKVTDDTHQFYTQHLSERIAEELALEHSLRRALLNEEFVLHYQPKVGLETGRLTGVEALIRWQSPERGLVAPGKFISVMEETGIIVEAGLWALRQAIRDRARWLERGVKAPRVAVNVSTVQVQRQDFVAEFTQILAAGGTDAGIDIEITESLVMADVAANIEKLKAIRDLGVGIAIDDFGTGYSSLGYLAKLPAEVLKIDRSFTTAMLDDPGVMSLVSTMVSLAHSLNLVVVAEGVETEEQAKILRLLRCDQMQGYLISKPMAFDDMTAYLIKNQELERAA